MKKLFKYFISFCCPIYGWILWSFDYENGSTCGIIALISYILSVIYTGLQ